MANGNKGPKVVVIGGGTGSFVVLTELKRYTRNITAIVNMSDDGGSTGVLRDELGVLPPGDVRQCLVALSESDQVMRDLFNYRFEEGTFQGHSFGNLFLTALEKTTKSFAAAVETAGNVLKITGQVVPVTLTPNKLVLNHDDGTTTTGQFAIRESHFPDRNPPQLALTPKAAINPDAAIAIREADMIIIAPSNLYTSLAPALIVDGMAEALQTTSAKIIYVSNLVTKPGQTDGFMVHDYVAEIERLIGAPVIDYTIYNQRQPSKKLLDKYAHEGEYAVRHDQKSLDQAHYQVIGGDLISDTFPELKPSDQLIPRTYIRHDSKKLAKLIFQLWGELT
jgi:uncharacterized cofD-like protein